MFKKRLLLILFLATVLIYAVALFWSIHDYQEWKKTEFERWSPIRRTWLEFRLYSRTEQGRTMVLLGFPIGLVWIVGIGFLGKFMKYSDLKFLAIILPACGFLCFLLGFVAGFYYETILYPLGHGMLHPYRDYSIPLMALGTVFIATTPPVLVHARKRKVETTEPED